MKKWSNQLSGLHLPLETGTLECLIPASLPLVLKNPPFTVISDRFISAFSSFPMHVSLSLSPSAPGNWSLRFDYFKPRCPARLGIKSRVTLVLQYYFTGLVLFPVETMKLGLYGTTSQGIVLKDTPHPYKWQSKVGNRIVMPNTDWKINVTSRVSDFHWLFGARTLILILCNPNLIYLSHV